MILKMGSASNSKQAVRALSLLLGLGKQDRLTARLKTAVKGIQKTMGLRVDGVAGPETLAGLVEDRMRRVLARLAEPGEGTPGISLSVGVAFGDRSAPLGDVFRDADDALYAAKRGGKGCCAFHGANS